MDVRSMHKSLSVFWQLYFAVLSLLVTPARAIKRTVGPPDDPRFENASRICNGSDPASFKFGACSVLISCVFNNLSEALKASLGSGTSIAALLPTILALIGSPPLELVQLALLSPHRALATCCFSIGLPSGLFRQLKPLHSQLSHSNPLEPRVREWTVVLPTLSSKRWQNLSAKLVMDVIIMTLASIMLWRNWVVTSFTMVPWRCEYSWLLFAWPIACMTWLIIAVVLLHLMKESIEIYHAEDTSIKYRTWELMLLPYTFGVDRFPQRKISLSTLPIHGEGPKTAAVSQAELRDQLSDSSEMVHRHYPQSPPPPTVKRSDTVLSYSGNCVIVRIIMPSNYGPRSWRWFEAFIESLAVGIYLYATFVLTSTLFLNADKAIIYSTVMTVCLSAVRILTTLF